MVKTLQELTRPNIWRLKPYSSARDEYNGAAASVFLDANENPYNMPHNRYPDPMQRELKTELSKIKKVSPDSIFLGNGSDEAIDLVFRAFCEPRVDNVVAIDPTYGMYQVCADVNDVEYRKVLLDEDFQFSADKLLAAADNDVEKAINYWWGMPTGVVDVICSKKLPAGTVRLVNVLKHNYKTGQFHTFTDQMYAQGHILKEKKGETLSPEEVIEMDWLAENIIGRIPKIEELQEQAKPVLTQQGIETRKG